MKLFNSGNKDKRYADSENAEFLDSYDFPDEAGEDAAYDDYYEDSYAADDAYDDEAYDDVPANEFGETAEQVEAKIVRYRQKKRRRRWAVALAILALVGGAVALAISIWVQPPSIDSLVAPSFGPGSSSAGNTGASGNAASAEGGRDQTGTASAPGEETPVSVSGYRNTNQYTFLIVGMDQTEGNTDTILVGTLDVEEHWLHIVSIPRDTMVNVPWGLKKINSIYAYATTGYSGWNYENGMEGVLRGVADIMGYEADCWAFVDIEAFVKLIDAIGGVYYDVPVNMNYSDPTQNLEIHFNKGYQWLSGEDALRVVRFRSGYSNADLGRISTQQDFIKAVASQMLSLGNIPNLSEVYRIYEEYVDTNLSSGNIAWFVTEFLKLDSEDIEFETLPGDYSYMIGGINYGVINVDAWLEIVNNFLSPLNDDITAQDLNIIQYNRSSGTAYTTNGSSVSGGYMKNPYS